MCGSRGCGGLSPLIIICFQSSLYTSVLCDTFSHGFTVKPFARSKCLRQGASEKEQQNAQDVRKLPYARLDFLHRESVWNGKEPNLVLGRFVEQLIERSRAWRCGLVTRRGRRKANGDKRSATGRARFIVLALRAPFVLQTEREDSKSSTFSPISSPSSSCPSPWPPMWASRRRTFSHETILHVHLGDCVLWPRFLSVVPCERGELRPARHPLLGDLSRCASALILAVLADLRFHVDFAADELNIATVNLLTFRSYGLGHSSQHAKLVSSAPAQKIPVMKSTSKRYVPFSSESSIRLPVSTCSMWLRSLPNTTRLPFLTILETPAKGFLV